MIIQSPSDLAKLFPLSILNSFGMAVKQFTPYLEKCPFCKKDTFIIDTDYTGGNWFYCQNSDCKFAGNILNLIMEIMDLSLPAAISYAIAESKRFDLKQDISVEAQAEFESYLTLYENTLAFNQKIRRYPFDRLPSSTVVNYMREICLWPGSGEKEWERVTKFAGLASKREITNLFPNVVKGPANKVFLTIPWSDIPGRVHSLEFVTNIVDRIYKTLPNGNEEESGLAFLSNLRASEDTVFAVGNSLTAAQMLFQYSYVTAERLPIVGWRENTNAAWNYVNAKKVIFWEQTKSWRIFDQAKRVKNALIANVEDITTFKHIQIRLRDINELLRYLEDNALPWPVVFKNTILKFNHM